MVQPECESCRKISYPTREAAAEAAYRIKMVYDVILHPYECRTRTCWHLTSGATR